MASGAERQQRLSGEAFQRLRNDHEQFLEAYESEGLVEALPSLGSRQHRKACSM